MGVCNCFGLYISMCFRHFLKHYQNYDVYYKFHFLFIRYRSFQLGSKIIPTSAISNC